jgi:hypothetical protein
MKQAIIYLTLALTASMSLAERPEAKILALNGGAQAGGKTIGVGGTIQQGQVIETSADGSVLLNLAAGQYVYLYKNTTVSVSKLQYGASGTERQSVVELKRGRMNSEVRKPSQGTTSHMVQTAFGTVEAKGTAWSTSVENGVLTVVVYSGTVYYTFPGISVSIPQGSVATFSNGQLVVVNLTTGTTMTYAPGQSPVLGLANGLGNGAILAGAAQAFGDGSNAYRGMATDIEQITFARIVVVINQVLGGAGIPLLVGNGDPLFPASLLLGLDGQGLNSVASPFNQ